ncbi:MAG: HAMP domain-containing sensor histidine kinase [Eubacteriales bacterium]
MKKLVRNKAFGYGLTAFFCLALSVGGSAGAGLFYANNMISLTNPPEAFDRFASSMSYGFGIIAVSCILASVASLVLLMAGAGYKKGEESPSLRSPDKIVLEVFLGGMGFVIFLLIKLCFIMLRSFEFWILFIIAPSLLLASLVFKEALVSIAVRYKCKALFKNTLLYRIISVVRNIYSNFALIWKIVFVLLVYFTATYFTFHYDYSPLFAFWIILTFVLLTVVGSCVIFAETLKNGTKKIAEGDLSYKINTTGMYSEFRKLGENINNIGEGLLKAVGEKTKSERFRTELITNVSHDIKTPLTSVVNYIDLLKRGDITEEQKKEYISVLERQSSKLKKLVLDLVDASKALTGNVTVVLAPTNLSELLSQAAAEYAERLENSNLTLITNLPDEKTTALADGRLVWRIFDNLFDNICKYSLPGTRAYIDVEVKQNRVTAAFKNISHQILNVSPSELLERFVRGDMARTSEGSGLGLSIAQSLAEIQNGKLELSADGDLFKVTVSFEKYTGEAAL